MPPAPSPPSLQSSGVNKAHPATTAWPNSTFSVLLSVFLVTTLGEGKACHQNVPALTFTFRKLLSLPQHVLASRGSGFRSLGEEYHWVGRKHGVPTGKEWEGKKLGPGVGVRPGACRPRTLKIQNSANSRVQAGGNRLRYTFLCQEMVAHPCSLESFGAP